MARGGFATGCTATRRYLFSRKPLLGVGQHRDSTTNERMRVAVGTERGVGGVGYEIESNSAENESMSGKRGGEGEWS